jgi:hypothetical protein
MDGWTRINGFAGFSQMEQLPILQPQQRFLLREFSGDRSVRRGLGHHDHQTSRHPTSSCGGFHKERFCGNNPLPKKEAWKNLNIREKKLLKALKQQNFQKVARHCERG